MTVPKDDEDWDALRAERDDWERQYWEKVGDVIALTEENDDLVRENDALRAERDSLRGERDRLKSLIINGPSSKRYDAARAALDREAC